MVAVASAQSDFDVAKPISPQICGVLRSRIIRCNLKPGDRISEAEVARDFGVSRQPVREAFIKLSEQGLLSILPQRGTIVSRITYSAVLDARFMREAIEADIVSILAARPDPDLTLDLRRQIAAQRAIDPDDSVAFTQADELFHRTLARAADKSSAWTLLEGLKTQMDRVRFLSLSRFPVEKIVDQHTEVVEAIAAGDSARADRAIRSHLREVLRDLPLVCEANPDFFERPAGEIPEPVNAPITGGETT